MLVAVLLVMMKSYQRRVGLRHSVTCALVRSWPYEGKKTWRECQDWSDASVSYRTPKVASKPSEAKKSKGVILL